MPDNSSANTQNTLLTNVAVIRPILIVLLVFYHAFAVYSGGWDPIDGFPVIKIYWWLDKLSYAFMLEAFVFVSGYVFGYQVRMSGERRLEVKNLFWGKFKRLIIPSIVFSLLYIILFQDITQPVGKTILSSIEGVAHMWFLPMLFWCFVSIWAIEKSKLKSRLVMPLMLLCAIVSFAPLPLQLNATMYYLPFFYVGYLLQRKSICLNKFYMTRYVFMSALAFFILFFSLTLFNEGIQERWLNGEISIAENSLITKAFVLGINNLFRILYSSVGITMLFILVGTVEENHSSTLPQWIIRVGGLCMGVYLIQQFILKGLYLYTTIPSIFGPYFMPWMGFIIALVLSLLFSYILRLTKVGRLLFG